MLTHIPPGLEHVMNIDPEILGGEPCFNGTRVPLETVVDNLAAGVSVERILSNYRTLTQEHIDAVLQWEHALTNKAKCLGREHVGKEAETIPDYMAIIDQVRHSPNLFKSGAEVDAYINELRDEW